MELYGFGFVKTTGWLKNASHYQTIEKSY